MLIEDRARMAQVLELILAANTAQGRSDLSDNARPGAHPSGGDIVTGRAAAKGVPPSTMAVQMLSVFMVSIG